MTALLSPTPKPKSRRTVNTTAASGTVSTGASTRPRLRSDYLKTILHYDPETGIFTWKIKTRRGQQNIGDRAGHVSPKSGYRTIRIDGKLYRAGRLAWLYMTGAWPKKIIDHRDRDRSNDRWENLREATRSQNNSNVTPYGKTGVLGVYEDRSGFYGLVMVNGKRHYAGRFKTLAEAAEAVSLKRRDVSRI